MKQGPTFDLLADDWEGVCPSMVSREWLDLSRRLRAGNSQPAGGRLLSEHYKHVPNDNMTRVAGLTKYIVHTSLLLVFTHLVCTIYK